MAVYEKSLHQLGLGGLTFEADGTYQMLFLTSAYTPNTDDLGHAFESDLLGIDHRETLENPTWVDRVLDFDDDTVTDPGTGGTIVQMVAVKTGNGVGGAGGGGTAATNRVFHITTGISVTWDGTVDSLNFDPLGLFRLGAA